MMAGDSITAQHLHSNYFEAFCFARYPNLKFAFRNSGVGGNTIPSTAGTLRLRHCGLEANRRLG